MILLDNLPHTFEFLPEVPGSEHNPVVIRDSRHEDLTMDDSNSEISLDESDSEISLDESDSEISLDEEEESEVMYECTICKMDVCQDEVAHTACQCNTNYHMECILTWLERSPKCPTCRCNLDTSEQDNETSLSDNFYSEEYIESETNDRDSQEDSESSYYYSEDSSAEPYYESQGQLSSAHPNYINPLSSFFEQILSNVPEGLENATDIFNRPVISPTPAPRSAKKNMRCEHCFKSFVSLRGVVNHLSREHDNIHREKGYGGYLYAKAGTNRRLRRNGLECIEKTDYGTPCNLEIRTGEGRDIRECERLMHDHWLSMHVKSGECPVKYLNL